MNTRRKAPGFGEWISVTVFVVTALFLFYQLYQYAGVRQNFPAGLRVAGVNVGGLTRQEAEQLLTERYINAPIIVYHRDQPVEVSPAQAEFTLDFATMMGQAEFQRNNQDFWAGYWGYLWGRPVDVESVPISASHNEVALRETIQLIANQFDTPALPPQPVRTTMTFQYGAPGLETNIEASMADTRAALYRPTDREAQLRLEVIDSVRPDISLLNTLLTNSLQEFEVRTGGVGSIFVLDLQRGAEVGYNPRLPMSGMDLLKLPIMLAAVSTIEWPPTAELDALLRGAATQADNTFANQLLAVVAGQDNGYLGAQMVNQMLRQLGLGNTFIGCPFDVENNRRCEAIETAANRSANSLIAPDPYFQTTAEDIGLLLMLLYQCAERSGGALLAIYGDRLTAEKCQGVLDLLAQNRIGSLIEEGVPAELRVAHRHGWRTDTYGDAGIVYSAGGDYVVVQFMHKPGWLAWEASSPLMADLSRATYNFFNFDNPYFAQR